MDLKKGDIVKNRYKIYDDIKGGSQGCVYLVEDMKTGKKEVLKVSVISDSSEKLKFEKTVEVWKLLCDSNEKDFIVEYKEHFFEGKNAMTIMEYCVGGDLRSLISKKAKEKKEFTEADISKVLIEGSKGLKGIHARNLLHRDIKPENFLIGADGKCKLADFNSSRVLGNESMSATVMGTMEYMAAEVYAGEYSYPADVFSMGAILYEMMVGNPPFTKKRGTVNINALSQGHFEHLKPGRGYSKGLVDIVNACLSHNPEKRPLPANILESVYVENVEETIKIKEEIIVLKEEIGKLRKELVTTKDFSRILGIFCLLLLAIATFFLLFRFSSSTSAVGGINAVNVSQQQQFVSKLPRKPLSSFHQWFILFMVSVIVLLSPTVIHKSRGDAMGEGGIGSVFVMEAFTMLIGWWLIGGEGWVAWQVGASVGWGVGVMLAIVLAAEDFYNKKLHIVEHDLGRLGIYGLIGGVVGAVIGRLISIGVKAAEMGGGMGALWMVGIIVFGIFVGVCCGVLLMREYDWVIWGLVGGVVVGMLAVWVFGCLYWLVCAIVARYGIIIGGVVSFVMTYAILVNGGKVESTAIGQIMLFVIVLILKFIFGFSSWVFVGLIGGWLLGLGGFANR